MSQLVGKRLYVVWTCPRVYRAAYVCLLLNVNLSIAGNTCREVCRECNSLVQSVGMERLGMTKSGTHSLNTGSGNVVERILLCKRPSRCLTVCSEREGLRILRLELFNKFCPNHTCSTHLCNLHKVVHTYSPEEWETRRKIIYRNTCLHTCTKVLKTIGKSISHLNIVGSASLLHMVAGDGDWVELRHIFRGVGKDIANDSHRELRWVDIGVTHHKLLEDIILDCTSHLLQLCTLLQTCNNVERHDRKNRTVHSHRDRHLVERNLVK